MGLFVKLGVVGELNHKTVCSFQSIYHLIVSRRCYLEEAPAYNHRAFSTAHKFWPIAAAWDIEWKGPANLCDWPKEESEWRWRDTCAGLKCLPLTSLLDLQTGGQELDMAIKHKSVTDLTSTRLSITTWLTRDQGRLATPALTQRKANQTAAVNLSLTCISISGLKSVFNHYWPFSDRRLTEEVVTQCHESP